jgi:hypothetical protein
MATAKINMMPTTHETLIAISGNEALGITRSGKMRIINFDFTIFPPGKTEEITLAQSDRPLSFIRTPVFLFDGSAKVFAFVGPDGIMGFYNALTQTSARGVGELVYAVN